MLGAIRRKSGFAASTGILRRRVDARAAASHCAARNILVVLGSAAFTLIALRMGRSIAPAVGEAATFDRSRAVQGIIGGIGFLGAGAIIQSRGAVHGLTTAAAMWVVGAIGVACGAGYYAIAGVVACCTMAVLYPLGYFERRWHRNAASTARHPLAADDD